MGSGVGECSTAGSLPTGSSGGGGICDNNQGQRYQTIKAR